MNSLIILIALAATNVVATTTNIPCAGLTYYTYSDSTCEGSLVNSMSIEGLGVSICQGNQTDSTSKRVLCSDSAIWVHAFSDIDCQNEVTNTN